MNTSSEQPPAAMVKKKSEPQTKAPTALIDSREEQVSVNQSSSSVPQTTG